MDKYYNALKNNATVLSGFLDANLYNSIPLSMNFKLDGGYDEAKRKRCYFSDELDHPVFNITILKLTYSSKFHKLNHSSVKWHFYNFGVREDLIGDILEIDDYFIIILDSTIAHLFINELTHINKTTINLEVIHDFTFENNKQEEIMYLSSMRLDNVVSKAFKLSRASADEFIQDGLVFVNAKPNLKKTSTIHNNSTIVLRHYGKIVLKDISLNHKNRYVVKYFKYTNRK